MLAGGEQPAFFFVFPRSPAGFPGLGEGRDSPCCSSAVGNVLEADPAHSPSWLRHTGGLFGSPAWASRKWPRVPEGQTLREQNHTSGSAEFNSNKQQRSSGAGGSDPVQTFL